MTKDLPRKGVEQEPFYLSTLGVGDIESFPLFDAYHPLIFTNSSFHVVNCNLAFSRFFGKNFEATLRSGVLSGSEWGEKIRSVLTPLAEEGPSRRCPPRIFLQDLRINHSKYGHVQTNLEALPLPTNPKDPPHWLMSFNLQFEDLAQATQYQLDVAQELEETFALNAYSFAADKVLLKTKVYPDLLETIAGFKGALSTIHPYTTVLDLGCGTGNLTKLLAFPDKGRRIVAIDKDLGVMNALKNKCRNWLSVGDRQGVVPLQHNLAEPLPVQEGTADFVLMVNVLYLLKEPTFCLQEAYRVLKPGGEIRLSGPKKDTKIEVLLQQIKDELEATAQLENIQREYDIVARTNTQRLSPHFHKWNNQEVEEILLKVGFGEILFSTDKAYAGQAMIIGARK